MRKYKKRVEGFLKRRRWNPRRKTKIRKWERYLRRLQSLIYPSTYEILDRRWEAFRTLLKSEGLFARDLDCYFENNWMCAEWKHFWPMCSSLGFVAPTTSLKGILVRLGCVLLLYFTLRQIWSITLQDY